MTADLRTQLREDIAEALDGSRAFVAASAFGVPSEASGDFREAVVETVLEALAPYLEVVEAVQGCEKYRSGDYISVPIEDWDGVHRALSNLHPRESQ